MILAVLLLAACEKPAYIDVPYPGDKIVLNTMMQADSLVYIRVTKSARPGATKFEELAAATVTLYEDNVSVPIARKVINGTGYFVSAGKVKLGSRYTVKAAYDDLDPVTASDTLPERPVVSSVHGFAGGNRVRFVISDRPGTTEYYRLRIYLADTTSGKALPSTPLQFRFDPSYNNEFINVIGQQYYTTNIISDERFDGMDVTMVMQTKDVLPASQYLVAEVTALTTDGYKYLKSLEVQGDMDPNFLMEPARVFTNVAGGYGIVAGINSRRVPFKAN